MRTWLRVAALGSFILLLPTSHASAQETIVDGLTWMLQYPSTWNAGAPKLVSDGLFYYAVFCGRSASQNLCTVARKRGDGADAWVISTRLFWSSQPASLIIDRKGRLNVFYNDYQLRHVRIDVPSVNLDGWMQMATDFGPQVGYLHASYNAITDEILVTFNETTAWRLYVGRKVGEGAFSYAPVPAAPPGVMYLYARTVATPGHYAVLVGEHVVDGPNNRYTGAMLFESASPMGPWTTRELYRVSGANLGVPYQNWVLANDLQFDHLGRLRALLHITEGGSGHANQRDGIYVLREEDSYAPRYVGSAIEDGFTLYTDPSGAMIAFAGGAIPTASYGILWFRSDDNGLSWQRQAGGFPDVVNPALVDLRGGSMLGPNLHVLLTHWDFSTGAFDKLLFGSVPLSPANTADRYAYEVINGDGTTDETRGFRDVPSGRVYSYVYHRSPDSSYVWTYTYSAGAYSQTYTADSRGVYRYTNSDGVEIANTPPSITELSPAAISLGSAATLTVSGANFKPGASVRVSNVARETTYVSATQLTTRLVPSDATVVGDSRAITVSNPDGTSSNALAVTIQASPATVTPSATSVPVGATLTLAVANGPANQLDWVGWFCPATSGDRTYVDWKYFSNSRTAPVSGQAAATITFTAPAIDGAVCVARLFSDNGFVRLAASASVTATVTNPVPAISSLAPASVRAGNAASISVVGNGFIPASVVNVNGNPRVTTFVSATQLNVAVPVGDVATAGMNPSITVVNGAPGGGASNASVLSVVTGPTVIGPSSALPGSVPIVVNNGPGGPTDWVGWYCPQTDADTAYTDWKYLSGTKTAPGTGLTSGTVTFQMPGGGGGSCQARLFASNGFTVLATTDGIAQFGNYDWFRLTMGPTAVAPGGTLTVTAVNGGAAPTSRLDWIGLFCPSTSSDLAYVDWKYMNNTKTGPPSPWTSLASVTFIAPAAVGMRCDARLFSNNGFSLIMASWPVTVRTVAPSLTPDSASVSRAGTISVTIANGPGNARDWVGLYCPVTNDDMGYTDWKYLSGSRTAPGAGITSGTITFTAPGAAGSCNVRFFTDDGFTRVAQSSSIIVQ